MKGTFLAQTSIRWWRRSRMLDGILNTLSSLLSNPVAAPFAAFAAGLITSITPCSLSQIPLVLGYVGKEASTAKAFRLSLVYAAGSAVTFTAFGIAASLLGILLGAAFAWWYVILGIVMLLMAMQIWGIINIAPSTYLASKNTRRGYLGALIAGIIGGIFSSPCSTPVLVALIAMIAATESTAQGAFLMLLYSIGCTVLAVVLGSFPSIIRKIGRNDTFRLVSRILNILLGAGVFLIGLVLLYLGL